MYQVIIQHIDQINNLIDLHLINQLNDSGNMFIFFQPKYSKDGFLKNNIFDVCTILKEKKISIVNIIVYPGEANANSSSYIIWGVKNEKEMYFDKDMIREKHIWKDVEWGKREKNYNPKGKDPGNVWIPTNDDGKGVITEHLILSREELLNRCILSGSKTGDKILIYFDTIQTEKLPIDRDIDFHAVSIDYLDANIQYTDFGKGEDRGGYEGNIYFKSSEKMEELPNESVNLMVTSPPYWDLKNYFKEGQIGHESYTEYIQRMDLIWSETFRVLNDTGSMWVNINTRKKNGELLLIPNDIIKSCEKIGFKLKDIFIWHKSSGIPVGKNNLVDRFEYFIWFTKGPNFTFNRCSFSDYKNQILNGKNIWNINRKAGSVGSDYIHPAIFPTELIDRIINVCSNKGDIILDPFLGSGTSAISAFKNGRGFIGYEFNEDFLSLMKHRFSNEIDANNVDKIKYHYGKISTGKIFRKELSIK